MQFYFIESRAEFRAFSGVIKVSLTLKGLKIGRFYGEFHIKFRIF
ncbi:hypothetical protein [Helicobacter saguini]|nr:hypothetical protein [Helicobacter saguini]